MALKKPGSLDFNDGGLGWFVCYYMCPVCKNKIKVILRNDDFSILQEKLAKTKHRNYDFRPALKKALTSLIGMI